MSPATAPAPTTAPAVPANPITPATDILIRVQVRQRIRAGHVSDADGDDLAQHLRAALVRVAHRHRPEHGAWSTFARAVVRSEIQKWLRHRLRDCRNDTRVRSINATDGSGLASWAAEIPDPNAAAALAQVDRRAAVTEALAVLASEDRQVAQLLMGENATGVQRRLGWCKRRLYQSIARIRVALAPIARDG